MSKDDKALADVILKRLDKSVEKGKSEKALIYVDNVLSELISAGVKTSVGAITKEQFQKDMLENKDKILGAILHSIKPEYRPLYIVVLKMIDDACRGEYTEIMKFVGGEQKK